MINKVASALNTFMSIDKISSNDEMYSIFGSKKFNQLMIKCKEGYQSWMSKNSGVKYDGNRAMVGLKNLYSDIGKMKTLEDAKKLYEKKSLINSYYGEIINGLILILEGLQSNKMQEFVSNFDEIKKKLKDASAAINKK